MTAVVITSVGAVVAAKHKTATGVASTASIAGTKRAAGTDCAASTSCIVIAVARMWASAAGMTSTAGLMNRSYPSLTGSAAFDAFSDANAAVCHCIKGSVVVCLIDGIDALSILDAVSTIVFLVWAVMLLGLGTR